MKIKIKISTPNHSDVVLYNPKKYIIMNFEVQNTTNLQEIL